MSDDSATFSCDVAGLMGKVGQLKQLVHDGCKVEGTGTECLLLNCDETRKGHRNLQNPRRHAAQEAEQVVH